MMYTPARRRVKVSEWRERAGGRERAGRTESTGDAGKDRAVRATEEDADVAAVRFGEERADRLQTSRGTNESASSSRNR